MANGNQLVPEQSPRQIETLQECLLVLAEHYFGPRGTQVQRNNSVTFGADGPGILWRNTNTTVGVQLSEHARNKWNTTAYELLHECVHLLDPIRGAAKVLEEGFAVTFQHHVYPALTGDTFQTSDVNYLQAERLVGGLANGGGIDAILRIGKDIRDHYGSFDSIDQTDFTRRYPHVLPSDIPKLFARFQPT